MRKEVNRNPKISAKLTTVLELNRISLIIPRILTSLILITAITMASNFDLSLADDDDVMSGLAEDEEDYSNREEFDRCISPPSPSVLPDFGFENEDSDEDDNNRNPFLDDDEVLKMASDYNPSPAKCLTKIKLCALENKTSLATDEIIGLQEIIIKYFMVIF